MGNDQHISRTQYRFKLRYAQKEIEGRFDNRGGFQKKTTTKVNNKWDMISIFFEHDTDLS